MAEILQNAPQRRLRALNRHFGPATRCDVRGEDSAGSAPHRHPSLRFACADPPLLWTGAQWRAMESRQQTSPALDMARVKSLFDQDKFLRDGVLVLPGVMADPGRWVASLKELQKLNDAFVRSDWGSWVDWASLSGAEPPLQSGLTSEQQQRALGNSQSIKSAPVPHGLRAKTTHQDLAGELLLRRHSVTPEYFPPGHDKFLMEMLTHPDLLELHCMLCGCAAEELRFDHSQLFNRRAGHKGVTWHSHLIGGAQDVMHATTHHPQVAGVTPGPVIPAEPSGQPLRAQPRGSRGHPERLPAVP